MTELPTHGDFHVFFRGISKPLGRIAYSELTNVISEMIWQMGVGETDRDPLVLFESYHLAAVYKMVHASRGIDDDAERVIEYRVFNVFDDRNDLIKTLTFQQARDLADGEC